MEILWDEMTSLNCKPLPNTYLILIKHYLKLGETEKAQEKYELFLRAGHSTNEADKKSLAAAGLLT